MFIFHSSESTVGQLCVFTPNYKYDFLESSKVTVEVGERAWKSTFVLRWSGPEVMVLYYFYVTYVTRNVCDFYISSIYNYLDWI